MLYYQVKKADKLSRLDGYIQTVANELFTPAEYRKYSQPDRHGYRLRPEWVRPVEVSRKRVYWFFGARLADVADIAPATV